MRCRWCHRFFELLSDKRSEAEALESSYSVAHHLETQEVAIKFLERSVASYEQCLAPRQLLDVKAKLAGQYFTLQRFDEAEKLCRSVLAVSARNPEWRARTASTAPLILAEICALSNRKPEALRLLRDYLPECREKYGEDTSVVKSAQVLYGKLLLSASQSPTPVPAAVHL